MNHWHLRGVLGARTAVVGEDGAAVAARGNEYCGNAHSASSQRSAAVSRSTLNAGGPAFPGQRRVRYRRQLRVRHFFESGIGQPASFGGHMRRNIAQRAHHYKFAPECSSEFREIRVNRAGIMTAIFLLLCLWCWGSTRAARPEFEKHAAPWLEAEALVCPAAAKRAPRFKMRIGQAPPLHGAHGPLAGHFVIGEPVRRGPCIR